MCEGGTTLDAQKRTPNVPAAPDVPHRFSRIGRFGIVSGLGLLMDFCISVVLREAGLPPFWANLCGAACAVTFVFIASVRHVFNASRTGRGRKYAAYMVWQAIAVPTASFVIALLTPAASSAVAHVARWLPEAAAHAMQARPGVAFIIAKAAFTPVTFYANFLFMGWLLTGRVRWR